MPGYEFEYRISWLQKVAFHEAVDWFVMNNKQRYAKQRSKYYQAMCMFSPGVLAPLVEKLKDNPDFMDSLEYYGCFEDEADNCSECGQPLEDN